MARKRRTVAGGPPDVPTPREDPCERFVVAIGASAGGLEAFTELLKHLPIDTGMSFIFEQHLDPRYKSNLNEILGRATEMQVSEAADGVRLEPNHVYVVPPDAEMGIMHGVLQRLPRIESRGEGRGPHLPIDGLFRALAEDCGPQAIGVVLSGNGSDGTLGLRAIKAADGITLAQDEESAKYRGMPHSAAAAGVVDFVLPPARIAEDLASIAHHPRSQALLRAAAEPERPEAPDALQKIFMLLRKATNVDFTHYKQNTVQRRILRRMVLHKIDTLDHYVRYLRESPAEVGTLFEDMLINVTSFFRDPEAFESLKTTILPRLLQDGPQDSPLRVWVPASSTGEEVYSLAIVLMEFLAVNDLHRQVQMFATDVSDTAVARARAGMYPENIAADVQPERLRRFFVRTENGYQISRSIRDMCVFARQDVTKDPPFSQIDLVSCRNLLIYLDTVLQKRLIPVLHYALKPGGYLMLGASETVGGFGELFSLVDKKHKVYAKRPGTGRLPLGLHAGDFGRLPFTEGQESGPALGAAASPRAVVRNLQQEADRAVLAKYGPPGVVIDRHGDIVQFRGRTERYLCPAPGEASLSLLKMARPELLSELRSLLHAVTKEATALTKEGLSFKHNEELASVNLEVLPLGPAEGDDRHFLVLFQEIPAPPAEKTAKRRRQRPATVGGDAEPELAQLRHELDATKQSLQSIIEDHETTNEELRAANEEIQSSNEELQSTNEELETAKEELQSTNEELTTVNEELENRNVQLGQALSDLNNLLNSVNIPILILGNDLRIRSFTALAGKVLKLIPADVGRPVGELKMGIEVANLESQVQEVIATLNTRTQEVRSRDGRWYSVRVQPYRTADDKIDGAVVALVEISDLRAVRESLRNAQAFVDGIVATVREPLVVLDEQLRVVSANEAFYRTFQVAPAQTENRLLYDLGSGQWDRAALRTLLEQIIPEDMHFEDFRVEHEFPSVGRKSFLLNARRIDQAEEHPKRILLAIKEVADGPAR